VALHSTGQHTAADNAPSCKSFKPLYQSATSCIRPALPRHTCEASGVV
jgi:hypothetical protein